MNSIVIKAQILHDLAIPYCSSLVKISLDTPMLKKLDVSFNGELKDITFESDQMQLSHLAMRKVTFSTTVLDQLNLRSLEMILLSRTQAYTKWAEKTGQDFFVWHGDKTQRTHRKTINGWDPENEDEDEEDDDPDENYWDQEEEEDFS